MLFDEFQANATQKYDGLVATPLADRGSRAALIYLRAVQGLNLEVDGD